MKNLLISIISLGILFFFSQCGESNKVNYYTIGDKEFIFEAPLELNQLSSGEGSIISLTNNIQGQENPDYLNIYINSGLEGIEQSYSWDPNVIEGTYDIQYYANQYILFDWMGKAKVGSEDLIIDKNKDGTYQIDAKVTFAYGHLELLNFVEDSSTTFKLHYNGELIIK